MAQIEWTKKRESWRSSWKSGSKLGITSSLTDVDIEALRRGLWLYCLKSKSKETCS